MSRLVTTISHHGERQKVRDVAIRNISEIMDAVDALEFAFDIKERRTLYYPKQPKVSCEILTSDELGFNATINGDSYTIAPTWQGDYGDKHIILGTDYDKVFYSEDGGTTFTRVMVGGLLGGRITWGFVIPGKSIVVSRQSKVYVSTNFETGNHANWSLGVTADAGEFSNRYGLSVVGDVIAITTYGLMNAENPPRFLYLSKDAGKTWETVEVRKIADMADPGNFHLHDVEYDPWAHRLWVTNGDGVNSALQYSDDWGKTWTVVDGHDAGKATNIVALPDKVLFFTDSSYNGIYVWRRDPKQMQKPVVPEDIEELYTPLGERISQVKMVFNIIHSGKESMYSGYPYTLIAMAEGSGVADDGYPARIFASPDGEVWYEIVRTDMLEGDLADALLTRMIGPSINDPNRYCYCSIYHSSIGNKLLRFKFPTWVKVE